MKPDGGEGPWWSRSVADVIAALGSGEGGLDAATVAARAGATRGLPSRDRGPVRLFLRQFTSPLVLLLLAAAAVSVAVGAVQDGLVILAIVAMSAVLGFYQEYSAQSAVARLLDLTRVTSEVRRGGQTVRVPLDALVPGDWVVLGAGSRVPADGRIVVCNALQVDESPLTGESFPSEKALEPVTPDAPPAARRCGVFLGTHVVGGSGAFVVTAVGRNTELGHLSERLGSERPPTSFDEGLRRFGYLLLEVTGVLTLGVFAVHVAFDRPALEALLFATALAVGIIPELLPAILTVTLARGARRMAEASVVVKHLGAIENLGAVDVLCSDKTGTLTLGQVRLDRALGVDGVERARVLELGALNATFESGYDNPLDAALRAAWTGSSAGWTRIGEIGYDFVRKRLSVVIAREDGTRWLVTKGQLAKVVEICAEAELGDEVVPIDRVYGLLEGLHAELASAGRRTLGVAVRALPADAEVSRALEVDLRLVGVLAFADPPRPDAAAVIRELAELGVSLRLVTGDDHRVAVRVWRDLGGGEPVVVTGDQLRRTAPEGLERLVSDANVFAEVEPHHKERIVRALKARGRVVAYVGDGINDAAALHASDVGVTVDGAADVARDAADIVLQRPDLGVLAEAIREGRRTLARTLVYVRYTTSANFGNMVSMAVASVALPFLPLLPKQILLNNFLSDVPTVALTSDRVDEELVAAPRRWRAGDVPRFMVVFGSISSMFDLATFGVLWVYGGAPGAPREAWFQTGWFVESLLTELVVLLVLRTRRPIARSEPATLLLALVGGVALATLVAPYTPVGAVFGLVPLPLPLLASVVGITLAYAGATELAKRRLF